MKRMTTKEILSESFRELAESKSVDRITVQEIVDNCGYSTATFYRHFRDKYDLIAWGYTRKAEQIMAGADKNGELWKEIMAAWARYFEAEKEYLANLFLHTSGQEAFLQYMAEINTRTTLKYLRTVTGKRELDETTTLLARTYCLGCVCLSCEWILGKYDITPEKLSQIYEAAVPQPLLDLLEAV